MFWGGNLHTVFQPIAQIFPLNHQYMMALAWCTLEVFHWIVCFVHNRALRNIYHVWYFVMNVQSDNIFDMTYKALIFQENFCQSKNSPTFS